MLSNLKKYQLIGFHLPRRKELMSGLGGICRQDIA